MVSSLATLLSMLENIAQRLSRLWARVANLNELPGNSEYGEEWHQAGMQQNKHNTWRDFIACAEYLVEHGYTSPGKLAGQGGSAGGILIGRAFTERPDLFAVALDDVGLSDMIRDMFSPDGPLNIPEYGDLKTQDGFRNLYEDSAYYHVKDG